MSKSLDFGGAVRPPETPFHQDVPLVAVMRGRHVGSLHRGTIAICTPEGELLFGRGSVNERVYIRSAAKPFQIMPAILAGAIDRFGIQESELAVLCASHNAEPRHTEAVFAVLERIGLDESDLHCGVHPPLHEPTARDRWHRGQEPSPVCNNCSGAHAGMLLACVTNGWPVQDYGSPDHPLQIQTRQILANFAGIEPEDIDLATDNCHVPTFRLPIRRAAQAFACLTVATGVRPELQTVARCVVHAMTSYPEMVAGEERFDTDLMTASHGDILAKAGAEAFQGVGIASRRLGIALKISDGGSRAVGPAVMSLLEEIGVSVPVAELDAYRHPAVTDLQGAIVGELVPVFALGSAR